jgi:HK97 family phage prohead protease
MERRLAELDSDSVEVRESKNGLRFRGHAAVFDQEVDFGFMREVVRSGAFAKTIKDGADVRFLYNHNPDTVMARTSAGSLRLKEDREGLFTEADLDENDVDVQRLAPKLRSGLVTQMSFGFSVVRDHMNPADEEKDEQSPLRELREVELFDVSPVTFPAYEGTDGGLRDAFNQLKASVQFLGLPLTLGPAQARDVNGLLDELVAIDEPQAEPEKVRSAIDALTALLETDPAPLTDEHPGERSLPPLDFKRVLELNRNLTEVA